MADRKKNVGLVPIDSCAGHCCNKINTFIEFCIVYVQNIEAKWDHSYKCCHTHRNAILP